MHKKKIRSNRRIAVLAACGIVMTCTGGVLAPQQAQAQFICESTAGGGAGATATGVGSVACGTNAIASAGGDAFGNGAEANGSGNLSVGGGAGAISTGEFNVAVGSGSGQFVTGDGNTALGNQSGTNTTGNNNVAVGHLSGQVVVGSNNIAIGASAGNEITASNSISIGSNASAGNNDNAAAFGAGATATRANQQVFGTASNTYTMAGINSVSSRAAQSGPLSFVTSDSGGNLAGRTAAELGLASAGDINAINTQLSDINNRVSSLTVEARRGIAAVAALAPVITPSAPGRTTFSLNSGFYHGQTGVGFGLAHRLHWSTPLIIHGSYSNGGGREHIGRVGFAAEF